MDGVLDNETNDNSFNYLIITVETVVVDVPLHFMLYQVPPPPPPKSLTSSESYKFACLLLVSSSHSLHHGLAIKRVALLGFIITTTKYHSN